MSAPQLRFKDDNGRAFPAWQSQLLGDISDVRDGTHESPKYYSEGYPLITSKNLLVTGAIDLANVSLISEADFSSINKRSKVESGDILFGMIGTIGNPVVVATSNFAIKNVALIKQKERLKNCFLVQYLKSSAALKRFENITVGNTQKFIALGKLRQLEIQLPTLAEQTKIANFLTAVDEKLAQLTRKHDLLTQYKKGVMQQIFSQELRFKDDNGCDFPDWKEEKLGAIGKVSMCKRILKVQTSVNGDVPFYKIGTFGKQADAYITQELYEKFRDLYPFPKTGDILISAAGTIGRTVVYDGKPSYFQDSNIVWIDNDESFVLNRFLIYCYETIEWTTENTTIARLYNDNLKSVYLEFPTLAEQTKIANFLTAIDEKINATKTQLEAVKQYKQGLLQQMFV